MYILYTKIEHHQNIAQKSLQILIKMKQLKLNFIR